MSPGERDARRDTVRFFLDYLGDNGTERFDRGDSLEQMADHLKAKIRDLEAQARGEKP